MTVIAYRDGVAAADSIMSFQHFEMSYGEADKIIEINGWLAGCSGEYAHMAQFQRWMRGSKCAPDFTRIDGMVIRPDGRVFKFYGTPRPVELNCPYGHAIGSGANIAIAAMMAGASAEEAVRIAVELDQGCGGPIKIIKQ